MEQRAFISLLKNPALMSQFPVEEFDRLARKYPYAQAVHMLRAKKYHAERFWDFDGELGKAAIYALDREKLYQLIYGAEVQRMGEFMAAAERREDTTDSKLVTPPETEVKDTPKSATPPPPVPPKVTPSKEKQETKPAAKQEENTPSAPKAEPQKPKEEDKLSTPPSTTEKPEEKKVERRREETPKAPSAPRPERKATEPPRESKAADTEKEEGVRRLPPKPDRLSFAEWLKQLKGEDNTIPDDPLDREVRSGSYMADLIARSAELEKTDQFGSSGKLHINPEEEGKMSDLARRSTTFDEGTITETLARIYEVQKKYQKAIEAYEKLSLKNPEKKAFFAQKISALKDKL